MMVGMTRGMGRMDGVLMINRGRNGELREVCVGNGGRSMRDHGCGYCGH